MQLHGEIISKHVDQLRINLYEKNQIVDVFFTDFHKFDVEDLYVRQKIVFSVKIQAVDYYSLKLGKFWLHEILLPAPPPRKSAHRGKDSGSFNDVVKNLQQNNIFEEYPE